jgi:UDP-2-acetamido-3-amino-2,3-dideoxy-glucuronate N-acetyltransferase
VSGWFAHETAIVDAGAQIGDGAKIWHFSHIFSGAKIGRNCSLGQNVVVSPKVVVGDGCKIQNNVSLYDGVILEDGVFCGPSCVFTNVLTPRSEYPRRDSYGVTRVKRGATIGANATIVCGPKGGETVLGEYCTIAAGAVVTKDVQPHALMAGVPARRIGWVSHAGEVLRKDMICAATGDVYEARGDKLVRTVNRSGLGGT